MSIEFHVYEEKEESLERPVKVVLRLLKSGSQVLVVACGENGEPLMGGRLLAFMPGGRIRRYYCVNKELGFVQDSGGHIAEG